MFYYDYYIAIISFLSFFFKYMTWNLIPTNASLVATTVQKALGSIQRSNNVLLGQFMEENTSYLDNFDT